MTHEQKCTIAELRSKGATYAKIGEALGISKDTVKSYCRRNNLSAPQDTPASDTAPSVCRECGAPLVQTEKQKTRIFCSRECRENWWHSHPEQIKKRAVYDFRNTAPTIVTSRLGSKAVDAMSEQEFDREMRYQAAVQIADALLKKGSISEEEYHQIKTKLLEKYRPTLSTLLSGKPLI